MIGNSLFTLKRTTRTVRDWLASGLGLGRPLRATHIFLSEAGPSYGLTCVGRSTSAFDETPHGLTGRFLVKGETLVGLKRRAVFVMGGVEGLNGVDASRLFLWRVPRTKQFKLLNVFCLCNRDIMGLLSSMFVILLDASIARLLNLIQNSCSNLNLLYFIQQKKHSAAQA